jgi:hypothetical protein
MSRTVARFARIAYLVYPSRPRHQNDVPKLTVRERAKVIGGMFIKGATAFGGKVAGVSGFVGGSILTYVLFVADLDAAWAVAIVLAAVLVIALVGAYLEWHEAYGAAVRFWPTWEIPQDRADTLRVLYEANYETADNVEWKQFVRQYIGGHRAEAQRDLDTCETAGYPLAIDRDDLRNPATPEAFTAIVDAFQEGADRWKAAERRDRSGVAE